MKCPECQSEINEKVKFCEYCGHEFPKQIIPQQSPQIPQPIQTFQPIPNQPPIHTPLQPPIISNRGNPRIRELEEKIEDYKNTGTFMIFCFYPVAIYLFIMRAKYKKELTFLKNPNELNNLNNPSNPNHPNYNLGWKTFGMWWIYAILGEIVWVPVFFFIIMKYEDVSMATPLENSIVFITMMLFVIMMPSFFSYRWYKKHKAQDQ